MNGPERRAAIAAEVARLGGVAPSVRVMAATIGAGWRAVARDYHVLGIRSAARSGRRPGRLVPVESQVPSEVFDAYCRVARRVGKPLSVVVREALVAAADTISTGTH